MAVVEIVGLRKTYRRMFRGPQRAVDGLDMLVEPGQVHGFLGPNGSGKTTTLRALLGLVRANAGEMRLLGEPVPRALPRIAPPGGRDRGEPAVLRQLLRPAHPPAARHGRRRPALPGRRGP